MKTSTTSTKDLDNSNENKGQVRLFDVPIPLIREKREAKIGPSELVWFEMKTHPDRADCTLKYTKTVGRLTLDYTPEQTLQWQEDLLDVILRQQSTTADAKIATLSRLVRAELWSVAETKIKKGPATEAEKEQGYTAALEAIVTKLFPLKALNRQKSYMHRHLKKPVEMTLRNYVERVEKLNEYLALFPPFNANVQKIPDDAHVEICYHGLPKSWKDYLTLQGFDEQEGTLADLKNKAQCIESLEKSSLLLKKTPSGKRDRSQNNHTGKNRSPKKSKFYCKLHGDNNTHDTNDCTTCDKVIAKLKSDKDNKRKSGESSSGMADARPAFKKVSWAKPTKKEELHALFQDNIGKVVAAAVAATQKMSKTDKSGTEQEFNNLTLSDSEKSERTVESVADSDSD